MAVSLRDSCDDPPNCRCEGCARLQRDVLSMRSLAGKPSQGQRRSYRLSARKHPYQQRLACATCCALGAACIEIQVRCSLFRAQLRPSNARSLTRAEVQDTDSRDSQADGIGQDSEACTRRWSRQARSHVLKSVRRVSTLDDFTAWYMQVTTAS